MYVTLHVPLLSGHDAEVGVNVPGLSDENDTVPPGVKPATVAVIMTGAFTLTCCGVNAKPVADVA